MPLRRNPTSARPPPRDSGSDHPNVPPVRQAERADYGRNALGAPLWQPPSLPCSQRRVAPTAPDRLTYSPAHSRSRGDALCAHIAVGLQTRPPVKFRAGHRLGNSDHRVGDVLHVRGNPAPAIVCAGRVSGSRGIEDYRLTHVAIKPWEPIREGHKPFGRTIGDEGGTPW